MSAQKATKKAAKTGAVVTERFYDIITRPVITEKATQLAEQNKIVFKVRRDAQKGEVKQAVEALFGVKVLKVNTVNLHGKSKLFKGRAGIRQDVKKAIVTLAEGQSIDFAAGIK